MLLVFFDGKRGWAAAGGTGNIGALEDAAGGFAGGAANVGAVGAGVETGEDAGVATCAGCAG